MTRKTTCTIAIAVAVVVGLVLLIGTLPVGALVVSLITWVRDAGALGVLVYAIVLVAFSALLLPTVELYVAAGMLWGTWLGTVVTTVLTVIASLVAFGLTRTGLRRQIAKRISQNEKLAEVDQGIADRSFSIAFLLRLSLVVPFGPLNYALAATKMSLGTYVSTAILGMLPCNLMFAYAGSLLGDVTQLGAARPGGPWQHLALWGGLAATVGASALIVVAIKHALDRVSRRHGATR